MTVKNSVIILFLIACACHTPPPLPPVDVKQPGWRLLQGQAVWSLPRHSAEIAGDILVASGPDGRDYVEFSKTPFPMVIAQANHNQWEVDFPLQNKHYAGPGEPPQRLIWLYLLRILAGQSAPQGWAWSQDASGWKLQNQNTGESIAGYFSAPATQ
jgi:hypothetical protein